MATINEVINALEKLQSNLERLIDETIDETKSYLTDDIKAQLYSGTDASENKIIPKYKNSSYAKKKTLLNPLPGLFTPDLKLSGNLYKGLFAIVYEENILFGSNVYYAALLEEKYSKKIFEPTRTNLNDYVAEKFIPVFNKKVETLTGFKLK